MAQVFTLSIKSKTQFELINITPDVESAIKNAGVDSGIAVVFVPHTTATLICNEDEINLKDDILKVIKTLKSKTGVFGGFSHDAQEGNAHAHIVSSFSGNSYSLIIERGRPLLGAWQSIMLLEMDGPRTRTVKNKIISEK